jgi:hypothetical protein
MDGSFNGLEGLLHSETGDSCRARARWWSGCRGAQSTPRKQADLIDEREDAKAKEGGGKRGRNGGGSSERVSR